MKKVYYEKVGRKYIPVAEYDSTYLDSFPKGNHLVSVYPGGQSRRFNIDPNYATLIAAGRVAEDAISKTLSDALDLRLTEECRKKPLTPAQKEAWDNLVLAFGDSAKRLEWPSVREAVEAAVKEMVEHAKDLHSHPAVQDAYHQYQVVCELVRDRRA